MAKAGILVLGFQRSMSDGSCRVSEGLGVSAVEGLDIIQV